MADIEGLALDEACAKAMGWTHMIPGPDWICPEILHWLRPDGSFKGSLPLFSTNAASIPEMLAWLHEFGQVTIYSNSKATVADLASMNTSATGRTISEALARLVVAVKEAKR